MRTRIASLLSVWLGVAAVASAQQLPPPRPKAASAPKPLSTFFEGTITYDISVSGPRAEEAQMADFYKKMDMHFRGGDFIVQMYQGGVPKTLLYRNDSNRVYVIDVANRRIFGRERFRMRIEDIPTAKPTGDSVQIMGLWCRGYRFTKPADPRTRTPEATTTMYVHPRYRVDMQRFGEGKDRSQAYFLIEGIDGCIPLKIVVESPQLTTTTTVAAIQPKRLRAEQFLLPEGFERLRVDYRR